MHICHVNLASGFSGGEKQTLVLLTQQRSMGYQLTVVANPVSPFFKQAEALGCEMIAAKSIWRAHKKAVTQHCDVMHAHEGKAIYWAFLQKWCFSAPYIITRRIDNPLKRKWLSEQAYKHASHIVGVSKAVVHEVIKRHPKANCSFIPDSPARYPTNLNNVQKIRAQYQDKFLVIKAAKHLKHKGFDVAINAARLLQSHSDSIHFVLLGSGPEEQALKALAADLNNLSFAGNQSNMGDWYAAANLLIHSSYTEGMGSVILEAMAAGLPVIGSKAGGIPDVIKNEESGLLFEVGSSEQLASSILRIFNDSALRTRLIEGANHHLHQFEIATTAISYQNLYSIYREKLKNESDLPRNL
ncbi:TPA: glycosyltransferase family 1 protein [Vibrio vulnificus]|nr:glycosyltransferase family 1 protein [Vibrio vulnificus]